LFISSSLTKAFDLSILVVGDVMLDEYWHGRASRISPEAPVPVVSIKNREERLGGAANVALNVKSLNTNVSLLGVVGQDGSAQALKKLLKEESIQDLLVEDPHQHTIKKLRILSDQHQLIRLDHDPCFQGHNHFHSLYHQELKKHSLVVF
jgi:rfaE bifunctional protein kinase chain/domain